MRSTVFYLVKTPLAGHEFLRVGALRTEVSARVRRLRIPLDRNDLVVLVEDQLTTAYGAVWTDRARDFRAFIPRTQMVARTVAPCGLSGGAPIGVLDLLEKRPVFEQVGQLGHRGSSNLGKKYKGVGELSEAVTEGWLLFEQATGDPDRFDILASSSYRVAARKGER